MAPAPFAHPDCRAYVHRSLAPRTSTYRYERFYWSLTSEGLLVVAGRNAGDNETLVKRYLRPQDAYIHADVHG